MSEVEQTGIIFRNPYRYGSDGSLEVLLLGRDTNGNRIERSLRGTQPYFYVDAAEAARIPEIPIIVASEPGPPFVDGRQSIRCYTRSPYNVRDAQDYFKYHGEADIVYTTRTRVDYNLSYLRVPAGPRTVALNDITTLEERPNVEPRVVFLDIEVDDENSFAMPENPTNQITAISVYDSGKNQYGCIFQQGRVVEVADVLKNMPAALGGNVKLFPVKDEHDLLGTLGFILKAIDPDIICGWNSESYDFPYIAGRVKSYWLVEQANEDLCLVFETFDLNVRRSRGRYALVDAMRIYQKTWLVQKAHSLQAVAMEHLGVGKVARTGTVAQLQRSDPAKWIAYNIWDSHLVRLIDADQKLISYFTDVAMMAGVNLEEVYFNSRVVDGFLMRIARESGSPKIVLPSKQFAPGVVREGKAAEVFDTVLGMHEGVVDFDFKSEYPSIMETCNISPETVAPKNAPDSACIKLPNGRRYIKSPGLIPKAIKKLREFRKIATDRMHLCALGSKEYEMWESKRKAIKFLTNSFTGVLDEPHWRLANVDMFEDVTLVGREGLHWNKKHIEDPTWVKAKTGRAIIGKVVLGDTDSCMFQIRDAGTQKPITGLENVKPIADVLLTAINDSMNEFAAGMNVTEHFFDVDMEGIFNRLRIPPRAGSLTQSGKKRYFGLWDWFDGKDVRNEPMKNRLRVRGIEVRRFNIAPLTKEVQNRAMELQLLGRESEIKSMRESYRTRVMSGELDDQLLIPCKLAKDLEGEDDGGGYTADQPHIRAMRNCDEICKVQMRKGEAYKWTYVAGVLNGFGKYAKVGIKEMAIPYLDTLNEWAERGVVVKMDHKLMYERCVERPLLLVYPELNGTTVSLSQAW